MKTQTLIIGAFALATLAFANPFKQGKSESCCGEMNAKQSAKHQTAKPVAAATVKGVQRATITIDDGKYSPSVISVKRGRPVELTFKGGKSLGCGGTIAFSSLNMTKEVQSGKTVTFKFTPKKAGTIAYTCGMGMYDGKVIVN